MRLFISRTKRGGRFPLSASKINPVRPSSDYQWHNCCQEGEFAKREDGSNYSKPHEEHSPLQITAGITTLIMDYAGVGQWVAKRAQVSPCHPLPHTSSLPHPKPLPWAFEEYK